MVQVTDDSAELIFLSLDEVLSLHDDQVRRFGGAGGIRDVGLLASAIAVPGASFDDHFLHEDVFHMAAAYAFHITENHPFVDRSRTSLRSSCLNGFLTMRSREPWRCRESGAQANGVASYRPAAIAEEGAGASGRRLGLLA
jgi:hypothetical protein